MTDKQENQFSTFTVLDGFLTTNSAVVATIPAFQRVHQSFSLKLTDIKRVDGGRQSIKAGKSEIKANAKNELAESVYQLASSLHTYAHEHNKPEILNRVEKSEAYFRRMRDTALILEAQDLVKFTLGIETELAEHGLTAEEIATIPTLVAAYETALKDLGTSGAEGTSATKSVYQLMNEAKEIVDNQLNIYAEKFKTKNPDFYNQYITASKVVNYGVRHEKTAEAPANPPA